jgi:hypothetical protein
MAVAYAATSHTQIHDLWKEYPNQYVKKGTIIAIIANLVFLRLFIMLFPIMHNAKSGTKDGLKNPVAGWMIALKPKKQKHFY